MHIVEPKKRPKNIGPIAWGIANFHAMVQNEQLNRRKSVHRKDPPWKPGDPFLHQDAPTLEDAAARVNANGGLGKNPLNIMPLTEAETASLYESDRPPPAIAGSDEGFVHDPTTEDADPACSSP